MSKVDDREVGMIRPLVGTDIEVNMEGVVAIQAHRVEREIRERLADLQKQAREAKKVLEEKSKALSKSVFSFAKAKLGKQIDAFNKMAKELKLNSICTVSVLHTTWKNGDLEVGVGATHSTGYTGIGIHTFPLSPTLKAQKKAADDAAEIVLKLGEAIGQCYLALDDLPSYERQLKAQVAEHQLGKTADGQALMAAISKNGEAPICLIGLPAAAGKSS